MCLECCVAWKPLDFDRLTDIDCNYVLWLPYGSNLPIAAKFETKTQMDQVVKKLGDCDKIAISGRTIVQIKN